MPESPDVSEVRVVLLTAPDEECARSIARALVEARIVACANLIPGVRSLYRWKGELQEDSEIMLVLKTLRDRIPDLERWLEAHHPYDVPECIALEPTSVEAKYLAWLKG